MRNTRTQGFTETETGIQGYRDTEIQGYRATGIQGYRDTNAQLKIKIRVLGIHKETWETEIHLIC